MAEEEGKKKRVIVESLGWLTESTIMPKKHKAIEGVGPSSILELKAHLYQTQEESKSSKDSSDHQFHRAKKKILPRHPLSAKNSGVDARAHKDKLELKAVNDGSVSYAVLERKAELYDKLTRGELSDEEDKEKYCVDFFRKSLVLDETHQTHDQGITTTVLPQTEDGESEPSLPYTTNPMGPGRTTGTMNNNEHKRFVREVHEEASEAREKASELKSRRQEQATARRDKLRQAYLRKQIEKLKATSKADNKT